MQIEMTNNGVRFCALLFAIPVVCSIANGQSFATGTAESVSVVMFVDFWQRVEPCESVVLFRPISGADDLARSFSGCTAKGIPYGTYEVDMRSKIFDTSRSKNPKHTCVVDQQHTICVLVTNSNELLYSDTRIKLRGLKPSVPVSLSISAIRSDWHRVVAADVNGEAVISTIWLELMATVVVDGRVLGAVYLDLRPRPDGGRRETVTLQCDVAAGRVAIVAGGGNGSGTPSRLVRRERSWQ
jgi:hypothetical protein